MLGTKAERDREFTAFVNAAMPELARIAWYLTGDVHGANELVQAALVKTYVAWPKVRQDKAVGYTRRVMVNHGTDQWRRTRREVLVSQHHEHCTRPARSITPGSSTPRTHWCQY